MRRRFCVSPAHGRRTCLASLLAGLVLLAAPGCRSSSAPGDLSLTVLFPDVAGLKPGDNVRMRGVVIGTVRDIALEPERVRVAIVIEARHAAAVTEGARFLIDTERLIASKRCIRIEPAAAPGAPLSSGGEVTGEGDATLEGKARAIVAEAAGELKKTGRAVVREAGAAVDNLVDPGSRVSADAPPVIRHGRSPELVFEPLSARIAHRKANRKKWDFWDTVPEPVLTVSLDETVVLQLPERESPKETHAPTWSASSLPFPYREDGYLVVRLMDEDHFRNDLIGEGRVPFPRPDEIGEIEAVSFGQVVRFRYRFRPAE